MDHPQTPDRRNGDHAPEGLAGHAGGAARARRRWARASKRYAVGCMLTDVSSRERCVTVAAHGEIDKASASSFCLQVLSVHVGDPWLIVIDMSDIGRIDSAGLRAITRSHDALRRLSCDLVIRDPSATARRMLDRHGLISLVEPGPASSAT